MIPFVVTKFRTSVNIKGREAENKNKINVYRTANIGAEVLNVEPYIWWLYE